MKKISFVILLLGFCFLQSCHDANEVKPEVERIELQLDIVRFDRVFASAKPTDLVTVKAHYPFMFQNNIADSLWILKMKDSLQLEIEAEVGQAFPDFSGYKKDIKLFFKHLKYYFPDVPIPKVVTLAEYIDYNSKVIVNDSLVFISLDNYLGKDHRFYKGFQDYISYLQAPHQILPDIAAQYAKRLVPLAQERDFLSQMVYEGKVLYFKERLLPKVKAFHLIGYDKTQYEWAKTYETMIWQYFVERDLLYSTKSDLRRRFLKPGPFTKFYLKIDSETPPRLGQYLGWQIVNAYVERYPEKSLEEIINTDEQILFSQSNYKP